MIRRDWLSKCNYPLACPVGQVPEKALSSLDLLSIAGAGLLKLLRIPIGYEFIPDGIKKSKLWIFRLHIKPKSLSKWKYLFSPNLIKNLEIYSHSNTFLLHKLTPYAKGK
ncbi:MAG: hypothetical protein NT009_10210 [Proteobacteria bacterium]|nr:hypothetical protein [Pseudomonadota bacterium]